MAVGVFAGPACGAGPATSSAKRFLFRYRLLTRETGNTVVIGRAHEEVP
jgi:hypothetical protein